MKALTVSNFIDTGFEVSKKTLVNRNNSAREVVLMNLISNIMIKDNDIKNNSLDIKKSNTNFDHGYDLYRNIEFGKNSSKNISRNMHMDMICNRII